MITASALGFIALLKKITAVKKKKNGVPSLRRLEAKNNITINIRFAEARTVNGSNYSFFFKKKKMTEKKERFVCLLSGSKESRFGKFEVKFFFCHYYKMHIFRYSF